MNHYQRLISNIQDLFALEQDTDTNKSAKRYLEINRDKKEQLLLPRASQVWYCTAAPFPGNYNQDHLRSTRVPHVSRAARYQKQNMQVTTVLGALFYFSDRLIL
jgi:hypothetical protein